MKGGHLININNSPKIVLIMYQIMQPSLTFAKHATSYSMEKLTGLGITWPNPGDSQAVGGLFSFSLGS